MTLSPLLVTLEDVGVTLIFQPLLGHQEGKGHVAPFEFVPFVEGPGERRGYLAIPFTFGPPEHAGVRQPLLIESPWLGIPENVGDRVLLQLHTEQQACSVIKVLLDLPPTQITWAIKFLDGGMRFTPPPAMKKVWRSVTGHLYVTAGRLLQTTTVQ